MPAQPDATGSQMLTALLRLREMILDGRLSGGDPLVERTLVDQLGVSRTPIRAALARLEHEGLARAAPKGGYTVRSFQLEEVVDALEVRGMLEGNAARLAAQRGVPWRLRHAMQRCVSQLDDVVATIVSDRAGFGDYVALNEEFHAQIGRAADSPALSAALNQVLALPFASPSAFVNVQAELSESRQVLVGAQRQHRDILEAILTGQAGRAEALARDHAVIARDNLDTALRHRKDLHTIPGFALVHEQSLASLAEHRATEPVSPPIRTPTRYPRDGRA